VADFRLEPGDLGIGRVHLALRLVQRIAGGEMRLAGRLGLRLGVAQRRVALFQLGRRALDFQPQALAPRPRPPRFLSSKDLLAGVSWPFSSW
jgi:hypothetical protein